MKRLRNWGLVMTLFFLVAKAIFLLIWNRYFRGSEARKYTIVSRWGKEVLKLLKVRLEVEKGKFEFLPDRAYVLMSNHTSFLDIPVIYALFPQQKITMAAKQELMRIPFLGWGMRLLGVIPINRNNSKEAMQKLSEARELLAEGVRVWIAPEGKRNKGGELGAFKRGGFKLALETNALVLPITLRGCEEIWPIGGFNFQLQGRVKVQINSPIDTLASPSQTIEELRDFTRAVMLANYAE